MENWEEMDKWEEIDKLEEMDRWEKVDYYRYILTKHNTNVTELIYWKELSRNFEERLHQKCCVPEASGKKSTSRASLRQLKIVLYDEVNLIQKFIENVIFLPLYSYFI